MANAIVVLPHPDSPTSPTVLLRSAVKSTPSTAEGYVPGGSGARYVPVDEIE